jgi:hypothetical protein
VRAMDQSINLVQIGATVSAIGTILSAISITPIQSIPESILNDLDFIGNILEAVGTAIASDEDATAIVHAGEIISIIGNIESAAGSLTKNSELQTLLDKQGGLLQLLGGAIVLPYGEKLSKMEAIVTIGGIIQIIGSTIQVFADDSTEQGIIWNAVGGWIQAVGAVIVAVAVE